MKSAIRFVSYVCVGCMYRYTCMGLRATEGVMSAIKVSDMYEWQSSNDSKACLFCGLYLSLAWP